MRAPDAKKENTLVISAAASPGRRCGRGRFGIALRGICRIAAPLVHELALTLPHWRECLRPIAAGLRCRIRGIGMVCTHWLKPEPRLRRRTSLAADAFLREGARQMKVSDFSRSALNTCVAAVMLSGCGGNAGSGATPPVNDAGKKLPFHKTFNYTGAEQMFTVPAGVKKITVVAVGARGGGFGPNQALPGRTWAIVPVTPGEKLAVFVGGQGSNTSKTRGSKPNDGGFNGGGGGGDGGGTGLGWGGGGASDVRQGGHSPQHRIVIAGGGGGLESSGGSYGGIGGKGGGRHGGAGGNGSPGHGAAGGGGGGTQNGGGAGGAGGYASSGRGASGSSGSLGAGGAGGYGGGSPAGAGGGGGGGGYYGGGGGGGGSAYEANGGGAGGGSGYVEPSAYAGRTWEGWKGVHTANGLVVLSWQ